MTLPPWIRQRGADVLLSVVVTPRAKRTAILGVRGDRLRLALAAPPVDGRANEAAVEAVAELCETGKRAVELEHGAASREKVLRIRDVSADDIHARIARHLTDDRA